MIALILVATELPQKGQLIRCLDALGDHFQSQVVGQRNDGPHDCRIVAAGDYVADEGAVDFELVERQASQVTQAGVASARK